MMVATRSLRHFLVSTIIGCTFVSLGQAENRLGQETSPYLRLHAHNPVDWYPWGAEALDKAKKENKVIFLSIGYSSCYWCHVMERESFMDPEIAKFLNANFVCIKVDREERPDLDTIYMMAVQMMIRRGGWPMSVFLTPETKPFFGGTYFPARDGDREGATGFLTLITRVEELWKEQEDDLRNSSNELAKLIRENLDNEQVPNVELEASLLDAVQSSLMEQFDPQYGGFGFDVREPSRPKFPEPSNLMFLLERARQGNEKALSTVELSLQKMHGGGIWDHIGGGFHRYSVDRFWHIPHFEKMLYDNGQLATVYAEAYELTRRDEYRRVVDRLLGFVLREMRDPQGGFYSALDAESETIEGKFYRWEADDVSKLLGKEFPVYAQIYGLDAPPNFEHEFHVPQLSEPLAETAKEQDSSEALLWSSLQPLHAKLLAERSKRPRPLTDEKVLASWNGLMIRGFADAGRILKEPKYVQAATDAANFVLSKMRTNDGRLYRTYTSNEAKLNAYLDDYAFLADGLIALHKATKDDAWFSKAQELTDKQIELFADERGGFYFTSKDHETLIARSKQTTDGAQPAGNSVAAQNLIYLARTNPTYLEVAQKTIAAVAPMMKSRPQVAPRMSLALAELLSIEEQNGAN